MRRVSKVTVALVLGLAAAAAAQDGGLSSEVEQAIRALRSPKPAQRIAAAKLLSRQSSDLVPALLPWSWGCGKGIAREGARPGEDCARLNEATYQVLGVLAALGRRESATCEPSCPAREALFMLTTAQGGIGWDLLPLEDDESALPPAVRNEALTAWAAAQFRDSFALPEWRSAAAKPSARVGTTSIFLARSTTPSAMNAACAIALYFEDERGRAGKVVARDAQALGLGCELGQVAAEAVAKQPGVLAIAIDWEPLGGEAEQAQTLLFVRTGKQAALLCSVSALSVTDLLARGAKLITVGPRGCLDVKGQPVGHRRGLHSLYP